MRILIAFMLVLSLAACGKKKAPAAPANSETQAAPDDKANEERNVNTPDDPDDAAQSSDPCEGGE